MLSSNIWERGEGGKGEKTHRPLRELQVGLAPSLGEDALVLLQASAHGARGDGEVAVVAVVCVCVFGLAIHYSITHYQS